MSRLPLHIKPLAFLFLVLASGCSRNGGGVLAQPGGKPPAEDARLAAAVAACEGLPRDIADGIRAEASAFLALLDRVLDESGPPGRDYLVLVDKKRALDDRYEPRDLVSLGDYPLALSRNDLRLRMSVMGAVMEMDAAAKAAGVTLVFSSAYRSYAYQETLYGRYVAESGREAADRFSARPGRSQHQLGTAIDFGSIDDAFAGTKAGSWLFGNAGRFGFSLSYPEGMEAVTGYRWESWHYRYIGKAAAEMQRRWFGGVQQYFLEFADRYLAGR